MVNRDNLYKFQFINFYMILTENQDGSINMVSIDLEDIPKEMNYSTIKFVRGVDYAYKVLYHMRDMLEKLYQPGEKNDAMFEEIGEVCNAGLPAVRFLEEANKIHPHFVLYDESVMEKICEKFNADIGAQDCRKYLMSYEGFNLTGLLQ